jgi:hypothetical protein
VDDAKENDDVARIKVKLVEAKLQKVRDAE